MWAGGLPARLCVHTCGLVYGPACGLCVCRGTSFSEGQCVWSVCMYMHTCIQWSHMCKRIGLCMSVCCVCEYVYRCVSVCVDCVSMCMYLLLLLFSHSVPSDLWDPLDCSAPGFPVLHYLPKFVPVCVCVHLGMCMGEHRH